MAATTTLAQGSSVTLTVVASDTLLIDGARSASATVEAVTGVPGSANLQKIVTHPGGQGTYGPFGVGTVKLTAIGGAIIYAQGSAPLDDEPQDVKYNQTSQSLVSGDGTSLLLKNRSTAAVQKPFSYAGQAVSLGTTLVTQHAAQAEFYAVQLFFGNWGGSTYDVTTARVASTPTHQDLGNTATWVDVTLPTATCPAGSGSGNNIVPGMIASNVMPIASVARTDDTTKKPLLQCRTYFAAAASAGQVGASDFANFNASAAANGFQYASRSPAGDATATFTGSQNPVEAGTWVCPMAVKFFYNVRSLMLASVGDSLTKGHLTTGSATGWPLRACAALSTSELVVTDGNFAWTGQNHTASMSIAKQVISVVKPNALTLFAWSPNDASPGSYTQALFDAAWARTMEIVELCRQNNIVPIICTSGAYNSLGAAENTRRKAQNAKVRALASICAVIDVAGVVDDAEGDGILAAYDTGDGLHYNDAGHAAIALVAATAIARAI